jgi:hypothetical protein
VKATKRDPSGFTCMDCGFQYPWVASRCEEDHYALCRSCANKRPSVRRNTARHAKPRRRCGCGRGLRNEPMCGSCHGCRLKAKAKEAKP